MIPPKSHTADMTADPVVSRAYRQAQAQGSGHRRHHCCATAAAAAVNYIIAHNHVHNYDGHDSKGTLYCTWNTFFSLTTCVAIAASSKQFMPMPRPQQPRTYTHTAYTAYTATDISSGAARTRRQSSFVISSAKCALSALMDSRLILDTS